MRQHQLFGFFHEIIGTVSLPDGTPPALLRVVGYGAPRFFVLIDGTYFEKNVTDTQLVVHKVESGRPGMEGLA